MVQNLGRAVFELSADTSKLKSGLNEGEQAAQKSTGKMSKLAGGAALAFSGIGIAAAGAGVAVVASAAKFDSAMSEVRTLLGNIADTDFANLKQEAIDFSTATGVGATESVGALYQAISAGVPRDNVFEFLETANKAAVGGVTDLETAVDGLSTVVNAWGADTIDAAEASDLMFTAVRLGKTTIDELSQSVFQVGPLAASLGVNFSDVTAAMATMTAQGVPTSVAMTQFRQLMAEASKSGSDLDKAIKEVAGGSFADLVREGRPVHEILEEVRKSMPTADFDLLFGSIEAKQAVLGITGKNFEKMTDNLDEMTNSTGATDAAYQTMADTLSHQVAVAWNSVQNVMLEVGTAALPVVFEGFQKMMDVIQPIVDTIMPLLIEEFNKIMESIRPVIENALPVLMELFEVLKPIITDIAQVVLAEMGKQFRWIAEEVLPRVVDVFNNNLMPVIRALGEWWANNKEPILEAIGVIAGGIRNSLIVAFDLLKPAIAAIGWVLTEVVIPVLGTLIGAIAQTIVAISNWREAFDVVGNAVKESINAVVSFILERLLELIDNPVVRFLGEKMFGEKFTNAIQSARDVVENGLFDMTEKVTAGGDAIEADNQATLDALVASTEAGYTAMTETVGTETTAVAELTTAANAAQLEATKTHLDAMLETRRAATTARHEADKEANRERRERRAQAMTDAAHAEESFFSDALQRAVDHHENIKTAEAEHEKTMSDIAAVVQEAKETAEKANTKSFSDILKERHDQLKEETALAIADRVAAQAEADEAAAAAERAHADRIVQITREREQRRNAELQAGLAIAKSNINKWVAAVEAAEARAQESANRMGDIIAGQQSAQLDAQRADNRPIRAWATSTPSGYRVRVQYADGTEQWHGGVHESREAAQKAARNVDTNKDGYRANLLAEQSDKGNELAQEYYNSQTMPTLPGLPKLATGGIIKRPTVVLAGEAGPEAIVPLDSEAGFGGGSRSIIITGPIYGYDDFSEKVRQSERDEIRFGGF